MQLIVPRTLHILNFWAQTLPSELHWQHHTQGHLNSPFWSHQTLEEVPMLCSWNCTSLGSLGVPWPSHSTLMGPTVSCFMLPLINRFHSCQQRIAHVSLFLIFLVISPNLAPNGSISIAPHMHPSPRLLHNLLFFLLVVAVVSWAESHGNWF